MGGIAGTMAASCTYPFSLVKVHLQTASNSAETTSMTRSFLKVLRTDGIRGLFNGLSSSILRQSIFNTARFGVYEGCKNYVTHSGSTVNMHGKIAISGCAGFTAAAIASPVDLITIRMQNDMKLKAVQRRNYKHVFDGLLRVMREEGFVRLYSGCLMGSSRGALMSVGQMASYDTIKEQILYFKLMKEGQICYLTSSTIAGAIATFLTLPMDVMKTKMMNAKENEFRGVADCFRKTLKIGPHAFYRGFSAAFMRLAPQTILTFLFLEQLKSRFGSIV